MSDVVLAAKITLGIILGIAAMFWLGTAWVYFVTGVATVGLLFGVVLMFIGMVRGAD